MHKLSVFLIAACLLLFGLQSCGNASKQSPTTPDESVEEDASAEAVPEVKELLITGDRVNVRAAPRLDAKVVTQVDIQNGYAQLEVSDFFETIGEKTDFWYKIDLGEGKNGWVFGAFTTAALSQHERTDRLVFEDIAFGDYFHLVFTWPAGDGYGWKNNRYAMQADGSCDFGYGGPHELNDYELDIVIEDGELSEIVANPEFQGRKFDVTWRVKLSDAYEGEGSMETVPMETPQILGLKLVEE